MLLGSKIDGVGGQANASTLIVLKKPSQRSIETQAEKPTLRTQNLFLKRKPEV